jgi:LysM repeat protein
MRLIHGTRQPRLAAAGRAGFGVLVAGGALASMLSTAALATNFPITPQQRATAQQVAASGVPLSELAATAPDSYTVKRGDTLWDISKLFLKSPWKWPELWGMNLTQIRNPHLIYPGQVLYLDKSGGRARLRAGTPLGDGTVKVSPQARASQLPVLPISTIPPHLIEPFLSEPLIVEEDTLNNSPRIVATQEGRVVLGNNDTAYVRGDLGAAKSFQVYRPAKPLRDPTTNEIVAYESSYLGSLDLVKGARPISEEEGEKLAGKRGLFNRAPTEEMASLRVASFKQEMGVGDRLIPTPERETFTYAPRAPEGKVEAQVMSIYEGVALAGQNSVVTLNRGKEHGIDRGHVLAVWRAGPVMRDRTQGGFGETVKVPDERYGYLLVFRVFNKVSYALVMQVENTVQIGDRATNP